MTEKGQKQNNKHNKAACKGCMYQTTSYGWCDYHFVKGRTRLADGATLLPNGGCKFYSKGPKAVRREPIAFGSIVNGPKQARESKEHGPSKYARKSEEVFRRVKALYDAGQADERIAKAVGINVKTVSNWRKRNGLKSNYVLRKQQQEQTGEG